MNGTIPEYPRTITE
ncbi:hypothetical protein CRE_27853 [Caenorhabditis remanei]|uniref:Uncharacterized protein n=1 Tax=Caenorhabditis remanei TaxID=31234 RepID=E3NDK6_CAERE|nr:hypothetical protein CRE_27853 [Caenorhabditis remanei]